jgi:RNA polymerase sigma factor (sigma-70 family)
MKQKITLTIKDEQLICKYKEGDDASMGVLYDRYSKKVYHKCLSYLKNQDDAYDVSQDILLKAFEKIHTFKGNSSFSTWLFSITTNHCIECVRKQTKNRTTAITEQHEIADEVSDYKEMELIDKKEAVIKTLVLEMPKEDRDILLMKYEQGISVKQMQDQFNLSASAIKMRLMRSRQKVLGLYKSTLGLR